MNDNDFDDPDPYKAAKNFAKHGVSFEQAKDVFRDPFAIEFEDTRENYGEVRDIIIGMAEERLLTVVYTVRDERIRIISARLATPYDRRLYHEENTEA